MTALAEAWLSLVGEMNRLEERLLEAEEQAAAIRASFTDADREAVEEWALNKILVYAESLPRKVRRPK